MHLDSIGKYERLSVLGHGATGIVYLARDTLLRRLVALKEIDIHAGDVARFLEEARLLDRLDHPNIVHVNSVDVIDGRVILDMEYVDGPNLQQMLRAEGTIPQDRALSIACQVLMALDYAHRLHVVHRDIKPANILVAAGNTVKLVDFGLAEILATNSYAGGAGTYAYMAPEDFDEERHSDHRSDLWAVGVTLFEMLTGHRPFWPARPRDPFAWRRLLWNEEPVPLTHYLPEASPELQAILSRALERDKALRYPSAAEFLEDIWKAAPYLKDALAKTASSSTPGVPIRTPAYPAPPRARLHDADAPSVSPAARLDCPGAGMAVAPRAAAPVVSMPPAGTEDAAPTIPSQQALRAGSDLPVPAQQTGRRSLLQRLGIARPVTPPPIVIEAHPPAIVLDNLRKGDERTLRLHVRLRNAGRRPIARITGTPPWVTVRPLVLDRGSCALTVTVHSQHVWEPGDYHDFIRIEAKGASAAIPIEVNILPPRRTFAQAAAWWVPLFACALMPAAFAGLFVQSARTAYLLPAALLASALLLGMLLLVTLAADLGSNEKVVCGAGMALLLMMVGATIAPQSRLAPSPSSLAGVGIPIGTMLLLQVFTPTRWKFWAAIMPILALITCSSFVAALSQ